MTRPTVHASAVLVGSRAVLIRGPSGSGKSRLAFDLILAGRSGQLPPAILVGDDRVHLDTSGGNLIVRPAPELAGLIEIRGLGMAGKVDGVQIFHAGTKAEGGRVLANGGRVLNVSAVAPTVEEARTRAYRAVDLIDWPEGFCRRDIAWRAVVPQP